jgi:creatinine amidohydrolase
MLSVGKLSSVAWAAQTRIEIRKTGAKEGSVVIIPVGSIEQHGYHLPVATDTLLADAVAHQGAERVADDVPVLVTPPIWSGYSPHQMSLGGTLTIELDHMLELLEDVAEAALDNGFDGVCFVNGHGGNSSIIDNAVSIVGSNHPECEITGLTYFELATPFIDEIRESDIGGMAHGGEFETSLMLHLYPDLVREGDAVGEYLDEPYDRGTTDLLAGGSLSTYRPFEEYSASGAIGDPAVANAEKGVELLDRLSDELGDVLRNVFDESSG